MATRSPRDLRVAFVSQRQTDFPGQLWVHAQRYLRRVPRCMFAAFEADTPGWGKALRAWRPSGILVHLAYRCLLGPCRRLGVPMVNTCTLLRGLDVLTVGPDNRQVGRLAADHLIEKGCRHFAFLGARRLLYSEQRHEGFLGRLEERGFGLEVGEFAADMMDIQRGGPLSPGTRACLRWLEGLPPLTGILVSDDYVGLTLCDLARMAGVDLATRHRVVSGHDRHAPSVPDLTGVRIPEDRWGRRAAEVLVDMARGGAPPEGPILIPPTGVVERESTAQVAVADEVVRQAVLHIQAHVQDRLDVATVARVVARGRRALEKRFRRSLGRSVLEEIHRVRLERARMLLAETDLTVEAVAWEVGFREARQLRRLFLRHEGRTPGAYRDQFRIR